MQQFSQFLPLINGLLKTNKVLLLICFLIFSIDTFNILHAQPPDPEQAIRDLKEGFLIIRIPTYRAKIDTLRAMVSRSKDSSSLPRLQKLLNEAIEERDTLFSDYTKAFSEAYNFSKVSYYFDYEARDLGSAHFYHLDGTSLPKEELSRNPVFYLHFERTNESHIDALIIYSVDGKMVSAPFPNNFTRGGISFLFVKLSNKEFASWRAGKINKKLHKYWKAVT